MPEIQLSQGTLRYHDEHTAGGGGAASALPTVVLIHGLLVNSTVWGRLVDQLRGDVRCIVPDLPLGSHSVPMNADADLSPLGLASLIAELLEKLDLRDVTLVGNDTGGALCQLVCAHHPERIGSLVLVNCDAFENFPPKAFRPFVKVLGRVPGALAQLEFFGRSRAVREKSMAMMPLTVDPVPDELLKAWISPLRSRQVRRDLARVLRGISPSYTVDAAQRLRQFKRPALIAWGLRDKFFPIEEGERLAATLPNARLERVEDARTFVQLDQPQRLAELVAGFAAEHQAMRSSAA
jgi:pimeloyl-ACP methyl ester carboxylesterase